MWRWRRRTDEDFTAEIQATSPSTPIGLLLTG